MPDLVIFSDRDTAYVRIVLRAMRLEFERQTREEIALEEAAAAGGSANNHAGPILSN